MDLAHRMGEAVVDCRKYSQLPAKDREAAGQCSYLPRASITASVTR